MSSLKEIQEFIEKISKLNIERIEIKTEELKLIIEKNKEQNIIQEKKVIKTPIIEEQQKEEIKVEEKKILPQKEENIEIKELSNRIVIRSPMVGTFYRRPKPDQPPFVEIGSKIKEGDVICIIEAMKLFNEIDSEYNGEITKIYLEDGSPVEFDQPLFEIKI